MRLVCEYPTGYVEPYPACYRAMGDYARMGQQLFANLKPENLTDDEQRLRQTGIDYFKHLATVTSQIASLAEKELHQEKFSEEEMEWLKEVVARKLEWCGSGGAEEKWTGWYLQLFLHEHQIQSIIKHFLKKSERFVGCSPPLKAG